jgi:amino acid adenylation domain-containing protein
LPAHSYVPRTLVELLRWRAAEQPNRVAYNFLADGETEEIQLSYGELDQRARAIGAWLQSKGATGERVLVLYPPGLEYIGAFFGCLYAGAVAVPAYPPRLNRNILRLQSIIEDARATAALSDLQNLYTVASLFAQNGRRVQCLDTDTISNEGAAEWKEPNAEADTLAFIQYTSGSTGVPRGVVLTHRNLLSNSEFLAHAFDYNSNSHCVTWLPVYHDMGLIGGILQPLYGGYPCTMFTPTALLQRPIRWLRAISNYKATISGGPNFAYDLCVRKITAEQRESLDLSSWRVAFNGSEPVRLETMERFSAAFESCGFRRESFFPCYGLAEATLIVSGGPAARPLRVKTVRARALEKHNVVETTSEEENVRTLVGSGQAFADEEVLIVNHSTLTECQPGHVGEIWVAGESVAKGYWNREEETEQTFHARLAGANEGSFLRTGDLGFLDNGELFVTGRLKDLIIIRGVNHYPQDIEQTVEECHEALRPGCGAAVSVVVAGEERLVIIHEVDHRRHADKDELVAAIRQAVVEQHGAEIYSVVLIRQQSIPKTSSGKIQRHACREAFLGGSLKEALESRETPPAKSEMRALLAAPVVRSPEEIEAWLAIHLASALRVNVDRIDPQQSINQSGLDSLKIIEFMHSIENGLKVNLPLTSILQNPTLAQLATEIYYRLHASSTDAVEARMLQSIREVAKLNPLSHGQQALWFLHQVTTASTPYNINIAGRIKDHLNVPALRNAFQKLADRHPSLRTTFLSINGEPVQQVHEDLVPGFEEIDAAGWSVESLNEHLAEECNRRFDLENGPLLRVTLFALSKREYIVLLAVHHIVSDLWSLALLTNELSILYDAEKKGATATLLPLTLQYTDYVRWQTRMLESPEGTRLRKYWQKQLAGNLPLLNLPLDRPRPPAQTYNGSSHTFRLPQKLAQQLKALGEATGSSLYTTLLAAYLVLLYRYTGQRELLVGSPTTGRVRAQLAGIVGYFVNPVVIRADCSDEQTFQEFQHQVRQTVVAALGHQDYPFNLLVERLQQLRDPSRSPVFQAMFVFQTIPQFNQDGLAMFALGESEGGIDLSGLTLESIPLNKKASQFDVTLSMAETSHGLLGALEYNTDLFELQTIVRLAHHFSMLLESIVSNPQQLLSELQILSAEERRQLLDEWNSTRREYPQQQCLHELFEAQVARTPDSEALLFGEERLCYAELNNRANQLAHYLRALGVGPEVRVGILVDRSVDMLICLLGILKTGGAYVPLDPVYPADRLSFMLEDSAAEILLTQERFARQWPAGWTEHQLLEQAMQIVCLDNVLGKIALESIENPQTTVSAGNLAYVIYTSGSTGLPKGVAIEHQSSVTLMHWAKESFSPQQLSGVLASTSICFDLSIFELFVPLSWGGRVILAENALYLPELSAGSEVTLVNTVPSAMAELVRLGGVPSSVSTVNLAGEALKRTQVQQLYALENIKEVYNLYGPSEDTTYSTYALIDEDCLDTPIIGRPLANTQVYLLSPGLNPVPVGVAGELFISGSGLTRGYLNRPDLTALSFLPNPFSHAPGQRLYRSGDLARYRPDSSLEFLGRLDHQVKIRGFRIELGEVESVLAQHPLVQASIVVAYPPAGSHSALGTEQRLIAYVVASGGMIESGDLREHIRLKLPEYMIPTQFVQLEELPLTPNGKVDRRALPVPEAPGALAKGVEYVGARTPVEELVSGVWAEVLKVDRVSVVANFFELGGHSLLATQVVSRLREVLEVEVPIHLMFEQPTIARISVAIENIKTIGVKLQTTAIVPITRKASRVKLLHLTADANKFRQNKAKSSQPV